MRRDLQNCQHYKDQLLSLLLPRTVTYCVVCRSVRFDHNRKPPSRPCLVYSCAMFIYQALLLLRAALGARLLVIADELPPRAG